MSVLIDELNRLVDRLELTQTHELRCIAEGMDVEAIVYARMGSLIAAMIGDCLADIIEERQERQGAE